MDSSLKTKKEVAALLGVDRKTLYTKEKNMQLETKRNRLNPREVEMRLDLFNLSDSEFKEKYSIPPNSPS